ncbi:MAG TPA: non-heme iron oxygenase ferredoxin subunit [Planctomycetaceae bacterium]|nr:non-heme iron oxygenase ferredoxin subunit [Planctomycetaceae bacterium]
MSQFIKVANVDEIEPGGRLSVVVEDSPVLVIRVGDEFFAIEDVCTHDGQPLTDGPVSGQEITCPRHGARFDLASGRALCMPATEPVRTFPVQVRDGAVYVKADED